MMRGVAVIALLFALATCNSIGDAEDEAAVPELTLDQTRSGESDDETANVDDIEEVGELPVDLAGVTPMEERVAVLGLLNKRNGSSREIQLQPGESTRVGDVLIRLRACERTAPWEPQRLTGVFVQLFVRETDLRGNDKRWDRVFSGWLYKERPALNVVEHRLYDVWPRACEMTYPDSAPSAPAAPGNAPSNAERSTPVGGLTETSPAAPSDESAESSTDA